MGHHVLHACSKLKGADWSGKWPIDELPLNADAGHEKCPYGCGTLVKDMAKLDDHKDARQLMKHLGATDAELREYD